MADMRALRIHNEERHVAVVRESPDVLSVNRAAIELQMSPMTIRSAIRRGLVTLRDRRLHQ